MQRRCAQCREAYETTSKRSRFCSAKCRAKAHREQPGELVALPTPPGEAPAPADPPPAGVLVQSVQKELADAGRLETFRGQAALDLARRIETAPDASLSQAASAHRELRAAIEAATKGAYAPKSKLQQHRDELAARREKQQA